MVLFSRPSEWLYLEGTCDEVGHTWIRSCALANLDISLAMFYEGMKLYLPLYVVSCFAPQSVPALKPSYGTKSSLSVPPECRACRQMVETTPTSTLYIIHT